MMSGCHMSNNKNVDLDYKWFKISLNNSIIDSIQLPKHHNYFGKMESINKGKYKFFFHNIDSTGYVYCDFIGLLDSTNHKWLVQFVCNDSVEKYGLIFPQFNGATTDGKYFLFTTGDAAGSSGVMIYKNNGKKVFDQGVLDDVNIWTNNNEFEFWNVCHNDTLPKLEGQEEWCQKYIWKNEEIMITNSISKRFVE
jgi:hypothetical protein